MFYYRFDDDNIIRSLGNLTFVEAKLVAKSSLRSASDVLGKPPPFSVVLFEKGVEKFRWTQDDQRGEDLGECATHDLRKQALSEAQAAVADSSLLDGREKTVFLKRFSKIYAGSMHTPDKR